MVSDILQSIEEKMRTSVGGLKKELATIRTGHATPALIEHVRVEYAGVPTPLNQIAGISAPGARLLVIQPWDKSTLRDIEKAILKSDLGLNPSSDGNVIRISIPPLSEERRQELIRVVRKRIEDRRIAVRNLRHEAMNELQKLTDFLMTDIEQVGRDKEVELMEV